MIANLFLVLSSRIFIEIEAAPLWPESLTLFMDFQFKAELLTAVTLNEVATKLLGNGSFGAQEKRNGKRRVIVREKSSVFCFNREGEKRDLPRKLVSVLLNHPLSRFVIDGELEGTVLSPFYSGFDALILNNEALAPEEYRYREERLHEEFGNFHPMVNVLKTAWTYKEKLALVKKLHAENAEGVVFKNKYAVYKEGRAGQHYKWKFWKSADFVVIGPSAEGKNSVEIGVFNRDRLHRVSGVSLIGRTRVRPGDVVEVQYLYSTKNLHIVQPVMLRKRDDKKATSCTADQLVINRDMK